MNEARVDRNVADRELLAEVAEDDLLRRDEVRQALGVDDVAQVIESEPD